uniref:Uncharacterized protein n=1 Tax=Avena sativa TaxID=4498 RepID=A0ACD5WY35_AVESA
MFSLSTWTRSSVPSALYRLIRRYTRAGTGMLRAATAACMNRRCSFCTETIGDIRCRAMEKILAGMTRPCKYSKYGCTKVVTFIEMRKHEETCSYGPYSCPFNGCTYNGVQLYDHVLDGQATNVEATYTLLGTRVTLHRDTPVHALLHRDGKTIFILLNGGGVPTGRSLSIVRVCPRPGPDEEEAEKVEYEMVARGDEPGSLSLTTLGMQYVRRLEGYQPERFLFVPDAFWGSSGRITVTVYV